MPVFVRPLLELPDLAVFFRVWELMSVAGASVVVWLATGGVPALADAPGQAWAAAAASSSAAAAETIVVVLIMLVLLALSRAAMAARALNRCKRRDKVPATAPPALAHAAL